VDGLVCVVFHIGIAQFWNDLRLVDHRSGDGLRRAGVKDAAATLCLQSLLDKGSAGSAQGVSRGRLRRDASAVRVKDFERHSLIRMRIRLAIYLFYAFPTASNSQFTIPDVAPGAARASNDC
jgi:hypothetical protein